MRRAPVKCSSDAMPREGGATAMRALRRVDRRSIAQS
jgi:hypothetical protein